MTKPLSPSALAVMDAVVKVYPAFPDEVAAAAIRAVVDQAVPESPPDATYQYCCHYTQVRTQEAIRRHLIAIANELTIND